MVTQKSHINEMVLLSIQNTCLVWFDFYAPVNIFSVMSGWVFLGLTSTKQRVKYLAQGHKAVTPVTLEPATP